MGCPLDVILAMHAEAHPVAKEIDDFVRHMTDGQDDIGKALAAQALDLMLQHRPAANRDHRLGDILCQHCDARAAPAMMTVFIFAYPLPDQGKYLRQYSSMLWTVCSIGICCCQPVCSTILAMSPTMIFSSVGRSKA